MPQNVRSHSLADERSARRRSSYRVFSNHMFEGISAQPVTSDGRKEWLVIGARPLFNPRLKGLHSFSAQWRASVLAPFAFTADMSCASEHEVPSAKID